MEEGNWNRRWKKLEAVGLRGVTFLLSCNFVDKRFHAGDAKDAWASRTGPDRGRAVLRRAAGLGVNFIDTAWYYGPFVSDPLNAEAIYPSPCNLIIATGAGRQAAAGQKKAIREL